MSTEKFQRNWVPGFDVLWKWAGWQEHSPGLPAPMRIGRERPCYNLGRFQIFRWIEEIL
jgi:hypothetical protein